MPFTLLERFPLPNIRTYIIFSIIFHLLSIYFAIHATRDPEWKNNFIKVDTHNFSDYTINIDLLVDWTSLGIQERIKEVIEFMFRDFICLWISINTVYCALVLTAMMVQTFVFGKLRPAEIYNMKEKFWNFVLYKFIFIFGVVKAQYVDEVLLWLAWFSIIGFLHTFVKLARDRFDYITTVSTNTSIWKHFKIMGLLLSILIASFGMVLTAKRVSSNSGLNILMFMLAECFLLQIRIMHCIVKYFADTANRSGSTNQLSMVSPQRLQGRPNGASVNNNNNNSERTIGISSFFTHGLEMTGMYYLLLGLELIDLGIELCHYGHMLVWGNILLSMASLAICMQLRLLLTEINKRIKRHRTYLWVLKHMERTYPVATEEELLRNSDNCAICWETMDTARKLPCGHLFHMGCLQLWLEQDVTCPTCRHPLNVAGRTSSSRRQRRTRQHFFHFDGSRYISWLPSFSVEVMHSSIRRHHVQHRHHLEPMARQIQQIFPHYPIQTITDSLRQTGSVDATIENILDGRISLPTYIIGSSRSSSSSGTSSGTSSGSNSVSQLSPVGTPIRQVRRTVSHQIVELNSESSDSSTEDGNMNMDASSSSSNMNSNENVNTESIVEPTASSSLNIEVPVQFHATPLDRQNLLIHRRQNLINAARNKYLSKMNTSSS